MPNSKRKCKQCGEYVSEWIKVPAGTFCGMDHALEFASHPKNREKAYRAKTRQFAASRGVRTGKTQEQLTQDEYNRWVKLEELVRCKNTGDTPECMSCGKEWTPAKNHDFACGHYKTRGARSDLAMDTRNTWLQCNKRCNSELSGNITGAMGTRGYTEGLKIRLGSQFGKVMSYLDRSKIKAKHSDEDYKRCRKWLAARNRELKKQLEMA